MAITKQVLLKQKKILSFFTYCYMYAQNKSKINAKGDLLMNTKIRGFETVTGKEDTRLPIRSTEYSAGYDFFAREDIKILPHNLKIAWTGIKAYMQPDEVLKLYNRSSMATKKGLMLSDNVAVIDADYYNNPTNEGEIGFMFYNFTSEIAIIKKGEKLGQGLFEKY